MKIYILLLFLIINTYANHIVLDAQGHTAASRTLLFDNQNNLISSGEDNSVRVWDIKTGKTIKKILGYTWEDAGAVFTMALTKDNKYLITAGWFEDNSLRVYDYKSAKIVKYITDIDRPIISIALSEDEKYLAVAADSNIFIYSFDDFKLIKKLTKHSSMIYNVKFIEHNGTHNIVSLGDSKETILYSIEKDKVLNIHTSEKRLQALAVSDKYIAIGGNKKEILIFDLNLNLIKTIKIDQALCSLEFSPNGDFLASSGLSNEDSDNPIDIYETKDFKKVNSFNKHTNTTFGLKFLDNTTIASAGGESNEIYLWDIKTKKVKQKFTSKQASIYSLSLYNGTVAYGKYFYDYDTDKNFDGYFSYKKLKIGNDTLTQFERFSHRWLDKSQEIHFSQMDSERKDYYLDTRTGGDYDYSDAVLVLYDKNDEEVCNITRGLSDGYRHNVYALYKDYIITAGMNGMLEIYDLECDIYSQLIGHVGDIWALAEDDDYLASAGADGIIRLWDLKDFLAHVDDEDIYYMKPKLNLFLTKDEWAVWSSEDDYATSKGAQKYLGYIKNTTEDKESYWIAVNPQKQNPKKIKAIFEKR